MRGRGLGKRGCERVGLEIGEERGVRGCGWRERGVCKGWRKRGVRGWGWRKRV